MPTATDTIRCVTCGGNKHRYEINHLGRCTSCQRRVQDDDDSARRIYNAATGDMLNTGIPGGLDMDMSTPL